MAKDRPADDDGDLNIAIDPGLIEAALAAVDTRAREARARKDGVGIDPPGPGEPRAVEAPDTPAEPTAVPLVTPETIELELDVPTAPPARVEPPPQSAAPDSRSRPVPPDEHPRSGPPASAAEPGARRPDPMANLGLAEIDEQRRMWQHRAREASERVRRLEAELEFARQGRDELDLQYRELRQAVQRLQQEADLTRQRTRKDREEAERMGEERVLRGLLDIVENVERGVVHAGQDPARVVAGLNMIAEQFRMLLKRIGVDRVEAEPGTPFDPSQHEAVLHMPNTDVPPGTVHSEVAPGFKLRGRLVRPARVVVASTPPDGE
ncbi:MAG: nucleotide exchange factor GrpE [Deltaproteobacteria bacterium]|nr:nucleotide exchange factor GrpE [Deltaproteobacteria bacterium]